MTLTGHVTMAKPVCQDGAVAAIKCAYCQALTTMVPVWAYKKDEWTARAVNGGPGTKRFSYRVATKCANCGELSVAIVRSTSKQATMGTLSTVQPMLEVSEVAWQPKTVSSPDFPDVPAAVARAAREAYETHSVGADLAAILMARTTIEATAKDKGIEKGRLLSKIDELKDQQFIRPSVADAAHAIRHLGNDMAHGDLNDPPSSDDAADVLSLMSIVLNEVYVATALTQSVLARHAKKDASDAP